MSKSEVWLIYSVRKITSIFSAVALWVILQNGLRNLSRRNASIHIPTSTTAESAYQLHRCHTCTVIRLYFRIIQCQMLHYINIMVLRGSATIICRTFIIVHDGIICGDVLPVPFTAYCPCCANMHKWGLSSSPLCDCGEQQAMDHIVDSCLITKLDGGLLSLHEADTINWLKMTAMKAFAKWNELRTDYGNLMVHTWLKHSDYYAALVLCVVIGHWTCNVIQEDKNLDSVSRKCCMLRLRDI